MTRGSSFLFEFVVLGVPVSLNSKKTKKRRQWAKTVSNAAIKAWPLGQEPFDESLSIRILYCHGLYKIDIDNLPKLMLDALKSLVYIDDGQVNHLEIERYSLDDALIFSSVTPALAKALEAETDFVHLAISVIQ